MNKIHFINSGVADASQSGGGVTFFRGLCSAWTNAGSIVTSYERPSGTSAWSGTNVDIVQSSRASTISSKIIESVAPGDCVVKMGGALSGREDAILDTQLAHLKRDGYIERVFYLDTDAPSRLSQFKYSGTYLESVLPFYDGVILVGGGARAAHEYRWLTSAPILLSSVAIAGNALAWNDIDTSAQAFRYDVCALFASEVNRDITLERTLRPAIDADQRVVCVGWRAAGLSNISRLGSLDGERVQNLLAECRMTLNVLRTDNTGYGSTHPCRIIEAAASGSAIVSSSYLGSEEFLIPGVTSISLDSREWWSVGQSERRRIVNNASGLFQTICSQETIALLNWMEV